MLVWGRYKYFFNLVEDTRNQCWAVHLYPWNHLSDCIQILHATPGVLDLFFCQIENLKIRLHSAILHNKPELNHYMKQNVRFIGIMHPWYYQLKLKNGRTCRKLNIPDTWPAFPLYLRVVYNKTLCDTENQVRGYRFRIKCSNASVLRVLYINW